MSPELYQQLWRVEGFRGINGDTYHDLVLQTFFFLTDQQKQRIRKLTTPQRIFDYLEELGYEITHVPLDFEVEIDCQQEWELYFTLVKKHLQMYVGIPNEE
jgi:hypothetical protein